MNQDRWLLANSHFEEIVDLPEAQHPGALERLCGPDAEMRRQVEELLLADRAAAQSDFMGESVRLEGGPGIGFDPPALAGVDWTVDGRPDEAKGDIVSSPPGRLGAYRILEEIGSGGMGTVYAAVRADNTMEQRVAIKVIRAGAENEDIVRRMWLERRILARLQHPNIARIYDAGSTDSGLPYFVMELVEGLPIDEYCARSNLGVSEKLLLIRKVCQAVTYANEKLVVHRDLKPSNILVTSTGEPKLLDFGVAKVLDPDPHPETSQSRTEPWRQRLTLEFASPEQIRGQPVSVGCDVYSLGVLLFLLLTGQVPRSAESITPWVFDPQQKAIDPPKPSRLAFGRGRELSGDLDSIVLGALQEDPRSRYASAKELGQDIDRYMAGFPVKARHGSVSYRVGKFVRRHLYGVLVATVVFALSGALLVSWVQSQKQAAKSRDLLEIENVKRKQVQDMMMGIFEQAGPLVSGGVDLTLRQAVDRYMEHSVEKLATQPDVKAALLTTLGWIYFDLGDPQKAHDFHQESLELLRAFGAAESEEIESLTGLAAASAELSQFDQAESLGAEALERLELLGEDEPLLLLKALNHHVSVFCLTGDFEAAEPFSQRALDLSEALGGARSGEIHVAKSQRARVLSGLGDEEGARRLYGEALEILNTDYGTLHPLIPVLQNNLAAGEYRGKDFESAIEAWAAADRGYREAYGEDYFERVVPLTNQGKALEKLARLDEAEAAYQRAIQVALSSPGLEPSNESLYLGRPAVAVAGLWLEQGRCSEVLELLEPRYPRWKKGRFKRQAAELVARCGGVSGRS